MPELSEIGALARRHDPDRFLCALFAPAGRREAMYALIGFNDELARAREVARTPIAALVRWQWWREVVEGAARRHEVATPLRVAIDAGTLSQADLLAMIDAREIEAAEDGVPDEAAFAAYLEGTAGGFAVAAGRLLGTPPELLPALVAAGALYGRAGVLRSVGPLARQGRCLLPAKRLRSVGLDPAAVIADPGQAAAAAVVAGLARDGSAVLAGARAALRPLPGEAIAAALPLIWAAADLRRLASAQGVPARRGLVSRAAVVAAGLRGRL